jgi:HD-GYP domain-containing protein (c-di-GMP phosphodiesterase class II)
MGVVSGPLPNAAFRTAMRLGPERTMWSRLRARVGSFLEIGSVANDKNFLILRPVIAGAAMLAVFLPTGVPGRTGVLLACLCAIAYNFPFAYLLARGHIHLFRACSLVMDNLTVIAGSLWMYSKMGAVGYESDIWLIMIVLIVSNSMYYGPIGSFVFTALWTGLLLFASLAFYEPGTNSRDQLVVRLVFFALTGLVAMSISAELRTRREHLQEKTRQSLRMLAQIVEARDTDAGMHLKHIEYYSRALALRLGLDEKDADEIAYAGMIHDVGKAQVPDAILKKAGPLTFDERQEIQKHTVWADAVLADQEEFAIARQVARWHHEKWDGTGYPDGLRGEQIPLAARIVAVADVYDALISERPYKKAWPADEAVAELRLLRGSHFDPAVIDAFIDLHATNVLRELDAEMALVTDIDLSGRTAA